MCACVLIFIYLKRVSLSMGICEQIHDQKIDPVEFAIELILIHGKKKISEKELDRLRIMEPTVRGIPIEILARGNLFQNDPILCEP